jgi:outer membrane murein-binding lipoprotein Lpp
VSGLRWTVRYARKAGADCRRSNLPHLENELAALEAQIKAAEERIARAQSTGQKA